VHVRSRLHQVKAAALTVVPRVTVLRFGPTLFGLAVGPFIAGVVSDVWGLTVR
jgi:hypothetical protein